MSLTPERIEEAVAEHGSIRKAAKALGRAESTLRGVLKRAQAASVDPTTAPPEGHRFMTSSTAVVEPVPADPGPTVYGLEDADFELARVEPVPAETFAVLDETHHHPEAPVAVGVDHGANRAERRAFLRQSPTWRSARKASRPFRRAFGDWYPSMRALHRGTR